MSNLDIAVSYDIEMDYITAAEYYERSIESEGYPDAFLNLSVLYFQFTDYGINASLQLPVEFVKKAFDRFDPVITEGISEFPQNTEMRFWKRYFSWRTINSELTEAEVLEILNQGVFNNVPFFLLYLFNPSKYMPQRDELLIECQNLPTAKNKWILSLIDQAPIDQAHLTPAESYSR